MNDSVVHTDSHPSVIHFVFVGLGVLVITFLVFSPVLRSDFLAYDDDIYVYNNPRVQTFSPNHLGWFFAHPYYRSYIPLTMVSHAIDYALWQNDPRGHHLTNLLLHSFNAVLVFLLGVVLLRAKESGESTHVWTMQLILGSAAGALLFALHPLRVEPVAWVSDRKDLLCTFFLVPSFIAYILHKTQPPASRLWYPLSLALFACALLSKSIAVTMPGVLLLIDVMYFYRSDWRQQLPALVKEKLPFFALSLAAGIVAMVAAPAGQEAWMIGNLTPELKLLFPFYAVSFYLLKTVFPVYLSPVYPRIDAWILLGSFAAVLALTMVFVLLAHRGRRGVLLAFLVFILLLLPTLLAISSGIQPIADRYSYTASISLFLLCGSGIAAMSPVRARAILVGIAGVLAVLGVFSVRQIGYWRDAETLWTHVVEMFPGIPLAHNNLGTALHAKGDTDGALRVYRAALALKPDYVEAWYNMGIAFESKGNADEAEKVYLKAIEIKPDYLDAYVNVGNLYAHKGKLDDALTMYAKALQIDPSDADAHYNMGFVYYTRGDREQALALFQKTTQLDGTYANAYFNAGVILGEVGRTPEALASLREAARLGHREARKFLEQRGERW